MKKYLLFESSEDAMKYVGDGEKKLVKAGGQSICLIRLRGQLVAVNNECPHRGHPLAEGSLNHLGEIVCASHAYRFDLENGQEIDNRCEGLQFVRVLNEDGKVYLEC
jgi:nitrite reductase/ring-hydroxylating ferredoxin subunit